NYTALSRQKLEEKETGVREDVVVDKQKKTPQDFALWFFTVGHFADHVMRWPSPWGEGFPGWHIECSAMSMKYLGETLDIHTGGIDHIPIHHTNEIAQSEGATGKQFAKFWVHNGWLLIDNAKMSKSKKNFYTIDDVKEKGIDPLALRYLFLTAHYKDNLNFTWKSLEAAQNALKRLQEFMASESRSALSEEKLEKVESYQQQFMGAMNNDLGTPQALAAVWEVVKSNIPNEDKKDLLRGFDEVLGLELGSVPRVSRVARVPRAVQKFVENREKLRGEGKFEEADEVRKKIESMGYTIKDTDSGAIVKKSSH
ncbi:class I tRNA ligase family protein, partial [Candidatus Microgenomates bacterium]|nr:class I tRNA ligase family protein [Candidatus Microgenomates bacterium]